MGKVKAHYYQYLEELHTTLDDDIDIPPRSKVTSREFNSGPLNVPPGYLAVSRWTATTRWWYDHLDH
jgi:hypothetical protein